MAPEHVRSKLSAGKDGLPKRGQEIASPSPTSFCHNACITVAVHNVINVLRFRQRTELCGARVLLVFPSARRAESTGAHGRTRVK